MSTSMISPVGNNTGIQTSDLIYEFSLQCIRVSSRSNMTVFQTIIILLCITFSSWLYTILLLLHLLQPTIRLQTLTETHRVVGLSKVINIDLVQRVFHILPGLECYHFPHIVVSRFQFLQYYNLFKLWYSIITNHRFCLLFGILSCIICI